jgi:hypothetical protein
MQQEAIIELARLESIFSEYELRFDHQEITDSPDGLYQIIARFYNFTRRPDNYPGHVSEYEFIRNSDKETLLKLKSHTWWIQGTWISENADQYFICNLIGFGCTQTSINLSKQMVHHYFLETEGYIWDKFYLSPDKSKVAILCFDVGQTYGIGVFLLKDLDVLPLKELYSDMYELNWMPEPPQWHDEDSFSWIDGFNKVQFVRLED